MRSRFSLCIVREGRGRAKPRKFRRNFPLRLRPPASLGQNALRSVLRFAAQSEVKCGFAAFARLAPLHKLVPTTIPSPPRHKTNGQKDNLHGTYCGSKQKRSRRTLLATLTQHLTLFNGCFSNINTLSSFSLSLISISIN